jgi:hypothetical protein
MRNLRSNLVKLLVMTGLGGALVSSASGCATTAGGSSPTAMTPAQAAQRADEECIGIPAKERDLGIFAYRDAIGGARPLKESTHVGKVEFSRDRGVVIAVRAQPGMTAPWLERVAMCHIAQAGVGRGAANPVESDALLVAGATVRVEEADTGFIVSVRAPDDATASEVSRRVQALVTGPSGAATAEMVSR